MNSLTLRRCALSVCAAASLLDGCGGLQSAGVTQGPVPQGQMPENPSRVTGVRPSPRSARQASVTETVLYSFGANSTDGQNPHAGLTYFKGALYGTTAAGGRSACHHGCGTVYRISTSGQEKVLHSFGVGNDGASPEARLIVFNGTLYGTTRFGGDSKSYDSCRGGCGVVFSITPSGYETILHSFTGSPDGAQPEAPVRNVNGTLYGTTHIGGGGRFGKGTAFSITPSGEEHVIHSFHEPKGAQPGALADLNGTLYGTTLNGGEYDAGTVFALSTSGREKLLYSFNGKGSSSRNGAQPVGGLVAVNHTLYGQTLRGGENGGGTVFSITPLGTEKVLHSFSLSEHFYPVKTLLNVNGRLYGTSRNGGVYNLGTVFRITLSGHESVLHSFLGGQDGIYPLSGVIDVNGTLYGTTSRGGAHNRGTVFSITL